MGFLIGATMSVPGVSGGTMALCLGCYGPLLSAAAHWKTKESLFYLLRFGIGGGIGFLLAARVLNQAFLTVPLMMTMLFCAAAGTGIALLGLEIWKKVSLNSVLFFLIGFGTVFAVEKIPKTTGTESVFLSVVWGIALAAGIILPGISTSHLLLVFGIYDDIATVSYWKDLLPLLPLATGVILGAVLLTKPLAAAWNKYHTLCGSLILGFAVGSLKALIEPCFAPSGLGPVLWLQIPVGVLLSFCCAWGILRLNRTEKMNKM